MLPFLINHADFNTQSGWSNQNQMDGPDSIISSSASASETARSAEASRRNHKESERRRRQRINDHLATLRTLLPNTARTDKASLLAEVVRRVKELRGQAADAATEEWPFPGESDEATVSYCGGEAETGTVLKATLCCEDRPGLNRDLIEAMRSVRARAVRAEMMTVGGRTMYIVVMKWAGGGAGEEEVRDLKRALTDVMQNRALDAGLVRLGTRNKRARVYGSGCEDNDD